MIWLYSDMSASLSFTGKRQFKCHHTLQFGWILGQFTMTNSVATYGAVMEFCNGRIKFSRQVWMTSNFELDDCEPLRPIQIMVAHVRTGTPNIALSSTHRCFKKI